LGFNKIRLVLYATFITNLFGFRLKKATTNEEIKRLRVEFSIAMLSKLNINIITKGLENIPCDNSTYMLICNHKSVIDPVIVEKAFADSNIYGVWVAKKELYNSPFFGKFTRNAGTILLDRESKNMSGFFKDVKEAVQEEKSIFIFPEGGRNKSDKIINEFKSGSQILAIKNKIQIIPVYIETDAGKILKETISDNSIKRDIIVNIAKPISPRDKSISLEDKYREIFQLNV
jgi:1-acyl-sn-glycerol-3-phosphate acyltransferase